MSSRISGEIVVSAHVDERGAVGNADETGKFLGEMELTDDMMRP